MATQGARVRSTHALAQAIKASGLSQRAFALKAGCSHATIGHLIKGRNGTTPHRAARIERVAGVKPGTLFTADVSGQICRCGECESARK